jgi:hypothetical protein
MRACADSWMMSRREERRLASTQDSQEDRADQDQPKADAGGEDAECGR